MSLSHVDSQEPSLLPRRGSRWIDTAFAARRCDHSVHFFPTLGHRAAHLARQYVTELGESLALAFEILVAALYKLDELAGVDVWVARRINVVDDFGWELDAGEWGVGGV